MRNFYKAFLVWSTIYQGFDPYMANMTHNLRALLKKGSDAKWMDVHSLDFKKIIDTLCRKGTVLKYYKPELELFLETDASGKGIGMALLQSNSNEKESLYPITYGSKTLTPAEMRYVNIERELLGVVGALEKFHYFTFGCPVTVLTNHKPLISIAKKNIDKWTTMITEIYVTVEQITMQPYDGYQAKIWSLLTNLVGILVPKNQTNQHALV